MDRKQILDIITITYSKIMQLRFNWEFIGTMVSNSVIGNNYPDLTWSLKSAFATDAYTTISSLLSTGNYSFVRLGQEYQDIQEQVKNTEQSITSIVNNFKDIRNQMFCHAVKKKSPDAINKIYSNFESIFRVLVKLHSFCCNELNIRDNDYIHYDQDSFESLQSEIKDFCNLLLEGYLKVSRNKSIESRKKES